MMGHTIPAPPANLSGFTWRPLVETDLPALLTLFKTTTVADGIQSSRVSEESLQGLLAMLGERIPTNTLAAARAGSEIAAVGMLLVPPAEEEQIALITGEVAPPWRRQGIGTYLMQWLEARARQDFGPAESSRPQILRTSCDGHLADRKKLFAQQGFQARRFSYQMRRRLALPLLAAPLPAELRLVTWTPEQDEVLMDAFNEAFQGHWGLPKMNMTLWQEYFTGVPQFRGDLSSLAMSGDQIAGFCVNWIVPAAAQGPASSVDPSAQVYDGWVEAIGVLPGWRGRGIASAMLANSLQQFKAEGLEFAALDVDAENPTGALRLYEKHGFAIARETVHFVKELN